MADHESVKELLEEDFCCSCCHELMVDATTLNCGHSFCRFCLAQWWHSSKTCPDCRQQWFGSPSTNILLRDTIQKLFPNELAERKASLEAHPNYQNIIDDFEFFGKKLKHLRQDRRETQPAGNQQRSQGQQNRSPREELSHQDLWETLPAGNQQRSQGQQNRSPREELSHQDLWETLPAENQQRSQSQQNRSPREELSHQDLWETLPAGNQQRSQGQQNRSPREELSHQDLWETLPAGNQQRSQSQQNRSPMRLEISHQDLWEALLAENQQRSQGQQNRSTRGELSRQDRRETLLAGNQQINQDQQDGWYAFIGMVMLVAAVFGVFMFFYHLSGILFSSGAWSPDAMSAWVSGLGPWSKEIKFREMDVNGGKMLGVKQLTDLWEYKAVFQARCIFLCWGICDFPRATVVYTFIAFHDEVFMPLLYYTSEHLQDGNENQEILVGERPPVKEYLRFSFQVLFTPYYLIGKFALHWFDVNPWIVCVILIFCTLKTMAELLQFRWLLICGWKELPKTIRKNTKDALLEGAFHLVIWHFIPSFICDIAFYYELFAGLLIACISVKNRFTSQ